MRAPNVVVVDFETQSIESRPAYPPGPVGVAIKWPSQTSRYLVWGHPARNNCSFGAGMEALTQVWDSGLPILFHNAKFDLAVAYEKLKLPALPWPRVHDTMFLAFLADPHAPKLGLKELCADILQWPADEQNELHGWIWEHRAELEATYGGKVLKSELGAWIAKTPGDLAGRYACGDVERTHALYEHLWPIIQQNGMGPAYDRERRLLPILMENERIGMRVDTAGLLRDVESYTSHMASAESWLRRELDADLNFDADRDVADALLSRGMVPKENWTLTAGRKDKSGHTIPGSQQLSVKKDTLKPEHFAGPNGAQVASALGYRNRLKTCLEFFMLPWLEQGSKRGGYISTNWNQTRGTGGGTRTGRPSTYDPNFLNISKTWDDKNDGYIYPGFLDVQPLPLVRRYILPDDGHVWIDIDFAGQELRVFADFSCGQLNRQYLMNPKLDPHQYVADNIAALTGDPTWSEKKRRTLVKNVNFGKLYGAGLNRIAHLLKGDFTAAKELAALHQQAMPDIKIVNDVIKAVVSRGDPIRTWGGRLYYVEAPKVVDGRRRDFLYKLINYRTQGSAADLTKQVINDWYDDPRRNARFLVQVYDEICISAPLEVAREQLLLLKEHMEADRLDVPMLADAAWGPNWHDVEPFK